MTTQKTTTVERRLEAVVAAAEATLDQAARHGVDLQCVGVRPLFHDVRLCPGRDTDWLIAPAGEDPALDDGRLAVPREVGRRLRRIHEAGIEFPAVYIAHEVPKALPEVARAAAAPFFPGPKAARTAVTREQARALVGPPGPHHDTVALAKRLGDAAGTGARALRTVLPWLAAAAALPLAPLLALSELDPVLLGAVTADGRDQAGAPAAWFVLAQWHWQG